MKTATRLRHLCAGLRRSPTQLAYVIPLLQQAADELDEGFAMHPREPPPQPAATTTTTTTVDPGPLRIDLHVYVHNDDSDQRAIVRHQELIALITSQGTTMSTELDVLAAEVANNASVDASAIALLQGLSAQIAALKNDPAGLQALSDSLHASSADLAAAVTANTPSA